MEATRTDHDHRCPARKARNQIIHDISATVRLAENHSPGDQLNYDTLDRHYAYLWGALLEHGPGGDEHDELCTCGFADECRKRQQILDWEKRDPWTIQIGNGMSNIPKQARIAMICSTLLWILFEDEETSVDEGTPYPTHADMDRMATGLQRIADLWDRG